MVDKAATKALMSSLATLKVDKAYAVELGRAMLCSKGVAEAYPAVDSSWLSETHKGARVLLDLYTSKKLAGVRFPVKPVVVAQWLSQETASGNIEARIRDSLREVLLGDDAPLGLPDLAASFTEDYKRVIRTKFAEEKSFGTTADEDDLRELADHLAGAGKLAQLEEKAGTDEVLLYLPTGIKELDELLAGEPVRGSMSLVVANTGDGKTFWLIQMLAEAMRRGYRCAFVSTEMNEQGIRDRYLSLQTGVPRNDMKLPQTADPSAINSPMMIAALASVKRAKDLANERYKQTGLGWYDFAHMPASRGPTCAQVFEWVRKVDETPDGNGVIRPVDVLIVDYADEIVGKSNAKKGAGSTDNLYQSGGEVFMDLHDFAQGFGSNGFKRWVWAGSQSQRGGARDAKGKLNLARMKDVISGSVRKVQLAEVVLGVAMVSKDDAPDDPNVGENGAVGVAISKMRNSKKGKTIIMEHALDRGALSANIQPAYKGRY